MTARMQLAVAKISDPRVVRIALAALALALALAAQVGGAEAVYACPATGGGCSVG